MVLFRAGSPRLSFNKIVVTRFRTFFENRNLYWRNLSQINAFLSPEALREAHLSLINCDERLESTEPHASRL